MEQKLYGGIELGGTKTICAIGDGNGTVAAQITVPTTSVEETFAAIFNFFEQNEPIISLGVGAFGPVQLDSSSAQYGFIYNSPKPNWSSVNVKGLLEDRLDVNVHIDTDVNCAALYEQYFGVAKRTHNFIYLTLGTGIGGSFISQGKLIRGISNLEMGHMRIPHEPFIDGFRGICIFHGGCLEGIASGPAMAQRYGKKPEDITDREAWSIEAGYLASGLHNLMMTVGPELIVLGGGLTLHPGLLASIRTQVKQNVNDYLEFPDLDQYIVESSGEMNGAAGAIKLASLSG